MVAEHPVLILMQLLQKAAPGRSSHTLSDWYNVNQ